jgi:hypothetical protein
VDDDSKGKYPLLEFLRWPPLKISVDVSDLSNPYCDLNENWYSDTVDYIEYFDDKKNRS